MSVEVAAAGSPLSDVGQAVEHHLEPARPDGSPIAHRSVDGAYLPGGAEHQLAAAPSVAEHR